MKYQSTLENPQWLVAHDEQIRDMFPDTWTHVANLNHLQILFRLKLLGLDWQSKDEASYILKFFERCGFLLVDGVCIRRNPHSPFDP